MALALSEEAKIKEEISKDFLKNTLLELERGVFDKTTLDIS